MTTCPTKSPAFRYDIVDSASRLITDQFSVLNLVTARLDATGIACMLTGSIAAGCYAQPRMTRDIDLAVEVESADAERIAGAITPEFNCDVDVIRGAIARQSLFNLIHVEVVAKVDSTRRISTVGLRASPSPICCERCARD